MPPRPLDEIGAERYMQPNDFKNARPIQAEVPLLLTSHAPTTNSIHRRSRPVSEEPARFATGVLHHPERHAIEHRVRRPRQGAVDDVRQADAQHRRGLLLVGRRW